MKQTLGLLEVMHFESKHGAPLEAVLENAGLQLELAGGNEELCGLPDQ